MRIKFIGTSHGVPEVGRFNSAEMIEAGGALYYVDAGAPILNMLINDGRRPEEIAALFITHCHGDHIDMLPHFIDLCNWYYTKADFTAFVPEKNVIENIYAFAESLEANTINRKRIRLEVTQTGMIYEDKNIKVTAIPTFHIKGRPSFAYHVESEGKRAVFTGDLSWKLSGGELEAIACEKPSDIVIIEKAHYSLDDLLPYLDRMPTKQIWFNHVNSDFDELKVLDGKYPFKVRVANDGDEVFI